MEPLAPSPPTGSQGEGPGFQQKRGKITHIFLDSFRRTAKEPQAYIVSLSFSSLCCITTDVCLCFTILKSPDQIRDSFSSHFPILVSRCLPGCFPGWWFNSDLQSPLWHPWQVNLREDFKGPTGGAPRWAMCQPVFPGLPDLDTRGEHRGINSCILSAAQILQFPFKVLLL